MSLTATDVAGPYAQAWADRDVDAIVALHTEDSVFHVHGVGEPAVGAAAVRERIVAFLALVPDLTFTATRVHLGPDHLVFEYDMSGTVARSPFVCDGVDVIATSGGLVARKDTYLDLVALQRQVGELPG